MEQDTSPSMQRSSDTLLAIISDALLSIISSHPIYLAYILFFSPHLLHLLSFLSPLLLPTSLLLLLTLRHPPPLPSSHLLAHNAFLTFLTTDPQLTSMLLDDENTDADSSCDYLSLPSEGPAETVPDIGIECQDNEAAAEALKSASMRGSENARGVSERLRRGGSVTDENWSGNSESLRRDGSMREWKRTLACKLYEERMTFKLCEERTVPDGCEEMDLLWEAYETDAIKADNSSSKDKGKKKKNEKEKEEKNKEEEECEAMVGELCCLQALRLSAGKMNLGVGRPNLVKISKAFKGMALFHRLGSRRSRKG